MSRDVHVQVLPSAVIAHINAEINSGLLESPDYLRRLDEQGAERQPMSPEDFGKFMAKETAKWDEVINAAGIKGE